MHLAQGSMQEFIKGSNYQFCDNCLRDLWEHAPRGEMLRFKTSQTTIETKILVNKKGRLSRFLEGLGSDLGICAPPPPPPPPPKRRKDMWEQRRKQERGSGRREGRVLSMLHVSLHYYCYPVLPSYMCTLLKLPY